MIPKLARALHRMSVALQRWHGRRVYARIQRDRACRTR
jgi:hypothetical protein